MAACTVPARLRHGLSRFHRGERGAAAVEFALVAMPFLIIVMGGCDMGHNLFMQSVLYGTVQNAARSSSLESGGDPSRWPTVDAKVRSEVRKLNANIQDSDVVITRTNYQDFTKAQAAQPEDVNGDGICSPGENWIDRNFNNVYDAKGGTDGQGGARDVVVYAVSVSYPRLFPMATLVGLPATVRLKSTMVLANQPYTDQNIRTGSLTPRACPL
ncbi:MAG TPA: TadE family protein [Sphingobium sp.]